MDYNCPSEQTVNRICMTIPQKLFEMCRFLRRDTKAEFLGIDVAGDFTKPITVSQSADGHVTMSFTVDYLSLEDDSLCLSVDNAEPKVPTLLLDCLDVDNDTRSHDHNSLTVLGDPGCRIDSDSFTESALPAAITRPTVSSKHAKVTPANEMNSRKTHTNLTKPGSNANKRSEFTRLSEWTATSTVTSTTSSTTGKKRGRPRKHAKQEEDSSTPIPKKRGRPCKSEKQENNQETKRKPGRPRKRRKDDAELSSSTSIKDNNAQDKQHESHEQKYEVLAKTIKGEPNSELYAPPYADVYFVTPSGRQIKKPARFRELYPGTDSSTYS